MKKILLILLICILVLTSVFVVCAEDNELPTETFYTGLAEMSKEELEAFHKTLPVVVDIKPNKIAMRRVVKNNLEEGAVLLESVEVAELGEEKVYATSNDVETLSLVETEFILMESVDVSESLTFPPVGDQEKIGACLPWAMCYYQLTNNHCVVNGLHAKTETGATVPENIMAPGFIYSLCNGGVDAGTHLVDVTETLIAYGCPNVNVYDLTITEDSLKQWCTDTNVWYDAMYNKPKQITCIPINTEQVINKNSNCVELIKRELANGYVLTFGTKAKDFEFTTNISSNLDNTGITEYGCKFRNNSFASDGHFMTIVGYDDTFWIDVNDNGQEDDGEFGAFKIMNSAGQRVTEYMTGYIWMAYDALGSISGVVNAPANRYPAMESAVYCIEVQKNYIPLLVAEVEITTAKRNDIVVSLGISDVDNNDPEYLISPFPNELNGYGAFYDAAEGRFTGRLNTSFSGGIEVESAVIPFDLTNVIKYAYELNEDEIAPEMRYFVRIDDASSDDENSIMLGDVTVVEPMTAKQSICLNTDTMIVGDEGSCKYIDFNITPIVSKDNKKNIMAVFNSDLKPSTVEKNVYFINPEGVLVEVECEIEENRIIIPYPGNGYEYDTKYELHIASGLRSVGGNSLCEDMVILVYILDELPYNEVSWLQ